MRKLCILAGLLLWVVPAFGLELVRQKNAATIITFPLVDSSDTTALKSGAAGLDSEIDTWSDGAAPNGFEDCTNEATEIGTTGQYYLSLTATEMNADYIIIQVKSTDAITQTILIRTVVGDPANLATTDDGGTINVTGGAVDTVTNVTQISGSSTAADNIEVAFDTNWATVWESSTSMFAADVQYVQGDTPSTSASVADAVWDETMSGHVTDGTFGGDFLDADIWTATRAGYLDNLDGHVAQTGDSYAIVTHGTYGNSAIEGLVDDLESRLTAARAGYLDNLNSGTYGNSAIKTAIDELNDISVADVWSATVLSDVAAGAPAEPGSMDVKTLASYLYAWLFNKTQTTATEHRMLKRDETTTMYEYTLSDDGTTFVRGEARAAD